MTNRLIKINTLTDYHLYDFLNCPQTFWRKHLLKKQGDSLHWWDLVDMTVNQAVREFFSLPTSSRSTLSILRSIERHWDKKVHLFRSRDHYFHVLGSMTTHLIRYLMAEKNVLSPLYTAKKMSVKVPEWDLNLTMTIPLAIWEGSSFTIKKFVTEENLEATRSWTLFTIFFCLHAFNAVPSKLEIINILSGTHSVKYPNSIDLINAKNYVYLLQETISDPAIYFHDALRLKH